MLLPTWVDAYKGFENKDLTKQVRIHEISRSPSNLCPPCRSDTPLAAPSSISRIFGEPKKTRDGPTDGRTDRRSIDFWDTTKNHEEILLGKLSNK